MKRMKFLVEKVLNKARLGLMEVGSAESQKQVPTPACLLYTRSGLAPSLTPEVLSRVSDMPPIAQFAASHFADHQEALSAYGKGVKNFTAMHDYLVYSPVQDAAVTLQSGYNDKSSVSVWTRGGRLKLDVDFYIRLQEAMHPDIFQALCDSDTDVKSSKKRVRKAVDRTLDFLDACIEKKSDSQMLDKSDIFGVIEGGHINYERSRSAKETAQRPVAGFVLEGFYLQGPKMQNINMGDITDILSQTLMELPSEKPRLFPGVLTPDGIMDAVAMGIDIFDTSFAYLVSERGGAFTFSCDISSKDRSEKPEAAETLSISETTAEVKAESKENSSPAPTATDADDKSTPKKPVHEPHTNYEINLFDKRFVDDFGPLREGCTCFTCTHHSRAYVNHLLTTTEILAGILLNIHNLHHYCQFFAAIRQSIRDEKFADLHQHIKEQR